MKAKMNIVDAKVYISDAQGYNFMQTLANNKAKETIVAILNQCVCNRLAFSDDEHGDDLTVEVVLDDCTETRLVNEVMLINNAIAVVDDNNQSWQPWEVGLDYITLLLAMCDELKREFNLN